MNYAQKILGPIKIKYALTKRNIYEGMWKNKSVNKKRRVDARRYIFKYVFYYSCA